MKELEDLLAGLGVEVSGRLVGQEEGRLVDQCPGDGHPLPLAARELGGLVLHAVLHFHHLQGPAGLVLAFLFPEPRVDHGQLDVPEGRCPGEKVEDLEDETDLLVPDVGQIVLAHGADQLPIEDVGAFRWGVQAADEVHERGFPGPGRPHNGHEFVAGDGEGDPAESLHFLLFEIVGFREVLDRDHDVVRGGHGHFAFFSSDLIRMPSLSSRREL